MSSDCVTHAIEAYQRRSSNDTNPQIVILLLPNGKSDSHWYYRSNQVISTSAFNWPPDFKEYEGLIDDLPEDVKEHFVAGRFMREPFLITLAKKV